MQIQEIKSLSNDLVKHWVKVRTDSSYRKEKKSALITGSKLIAELGTKVALKALILEKEAPLPAALSQVPLLYRVPFSILKKITGLEHPEPIAAETALPSPGKLEGKKFLLALDGVSDPGNLGTLLRTALALNWEGVFITSHSADPFNDKALRAAKGATFHLPLRMGTWEELSRLIQENQLHVYLADITGSSPDTTPLAAPLLLILGNESRGASEQAKSHSKALSIPMNPLMESLNVGTAGAILMYQIRKQFS